MFPGLPERLFAPVGREGYSCARTPADEVRAVVHGHDDFMAYGDRTRRVFDAWGRVHAPRLLGLEEGDSPKALMRDLSEDLLDRFAGLTLLDRYDVCRCLVDYWDEVLQDDAYLVWTEAARPRILACGTGNGPKESPDITVRRMEDKMDLLPPEFEVARYFAGERGEVERLLAEEEAIGRNVAAFVEEHACQDGPLSRARTATGRVTQTAAKARLRAVGDAPEDRQERDALEVCLDLMKAQAKAMRAAKAAQAKLDANVLARYARLCAAAVGVTVVGDKWMASIVDAILAVVERLTGELVDRVRVLEERYAESLSELGHRVESHGAKVEDHLKRKGISAWS